MVLNGEDDMIKRMLVITALFGVAVVMALMRQPEILITVVGITIPVTISLLGVVILLLMITIAIGYMTC